MKRCCTCKQDLPDEDFSRHAGGKRCRACSRASARAERARKRDRKLHLPYEVSPPKDFPQFHDLLGANLHMLSKAVTAYGTAHGRSSVVVPMDRFPQTGFYVEDRLRLEAGTGPGTEPCWVLNLDGVRARVRLSDKPLRLFAAWLTERYAVLGEPRLEGTQLTKSVQHDTLDRVGGREPQGERR